MKIIPKKTRVWAVSQADYKGNNSLAWESFEPKWSTLVKYLKEDFEVNESEIQPWNEKPNNGSRDDFFFYQFKEPINGYVGFIVAIGSIQDTKKE